MMRFYMLLTIICLTLLVSGCGGQSGPATAKVAPSATVGPLQIVEPWTRAAAMSMPKTEQAKPAGGMGDMTGGPNSAAYMKIRNMSAAEDRLIAAQSDVAQAVELHTVEMQNGVMAMRPVPAIDVPANGEVELKPGGFHVMLIGLKRELKPDETVTVKLQFEKAGTVEVQTKVKTQQ